MAPEEDDNQANESPEGCAAGPVCGERLAEARQARGISLHEIAKELHLDVQKVQALEQNNFELLGAPVFAKGHMRKYAELVGVPVDDVLSDYYSLNRSVGAPPVVGPPRKVVREISIGPWVGGIVVILVVASAAWWWSSLDSVPEAEAPQTTLAPFESESDEAEEALDDEPLPEPRISAQPAEELDIPPADDAVEMTPSDPVSDAETEPVVSEPRTDVPAEPAANTVEVVLSFAGDCWTEVTDATGRRLFFDLGTDGRSVTLTGVEPLGVLLGDSSNVSIQVDGFDYVIPAANRRGNTARLTIYGQ
jgi:cytoskeleton protein RodZ